jgi:3-hydroxyacyl-CoA dehydrogenase
MLVAEGMGIVEVDRVMRRFGMRMGPLELLDQVGLDIAANAARSMRSVFADRLSPHPALERMCEMGRLGQKTGSGFYRYNRKKKTADEEAMTRLRETVSAVGPSTRVVSQEEARERMVCLMVNEAAACLAEGLADQAEVIDLAMVLGTGWAPHRGGPLRYADDRGAANVVASLDALRALLGRRFDACAALRERATSAKAFYAPLIVPQNV